MSKPQITIPSCLCGHCGSTCPPQLTAARPAYIPPPTPPTLAVAASLDNLSTIFDSIMDTMRATSAQFEAAVAQFKIAASQMKAAVNRPDFLEPFGPRPPPIDTAGPAAAKVAEAMAGEVM